MKSKQVDLVNIGLIFISLLVAFKLPFHLFLFSYAVLGPLHYLTEINWLKGNNYFSSINKKWSYFFVLISFLIALPSLIDLLLPATKKNPTVFIEYLKKINVPIIFIAFTSALGFAFMKKISHIMITIAVAIVASVFLIKVQGWILLFGVFMPTLIHVYLFTLLFMLYGAIKSKSTYGYIGVACMIVCIVIIASSHINPKNYILSETTVATFFSSNMQYVLGAISKILGIFEGTKTPSIFHPAIIKVQIFIAFAYTYHYLNWFSKTSIIKWHQITKKEGITILGLWAVSVILYIYDYKTGFVLLMFLSYLHVLLEFPLNYITIHSSFKKIAEIFKKPSASN